VEQARSRLKPIYRVVRCDRSDFGHAQHTGRGSASRRRLAPPSKSGQLRIRRGYDGLPLRSQSGSYENARNHRPEVAVELMPNGVTGRWRNDGRSDGSLHFGSACDNEARPEAR
jgi:hypothetical protein